MNQRLHNIIEDRLVVSYLDQINYNREDQELILIDQLASIKSLITRKAFSLTDKHIRMIHNKFRNFHDFRIEY